MVVVAVVVTIPVMDFRRMGIGAVRIAVMFDLVTARIAAMRANNRDGSRDDGADQRQKNNCLDHVALPLRMILPENRLPLFRIMRLSPSSD
jgi:hypothetical protein